MIKTLAGSLRQHKKGSILTVCLSILEAGFSISSNLLADTYDM